MSTTSSGGRWDWSTWWPVWRPVTLGPRPTNAPPMRGVQLPFPPPPPPPIVADRYREAHDVLRSVVYDVPTPLRPHADRVIADLGALLAVWDADHE